MSYAFGSNVKSVRSMAFPRYAPPVNTARSMVLPSTAFAGTLSDGSCPLDVKPLILYLRNIASAYAQWFVVHEGTSTTSTPCSAHARTVSSYGSRHCALIHTLGRVASGVAGAVRGRPSTPPSRIRAKILSFTVFLQLSIGVLSSQSCRYVALASRGSLILLQSASLM